MALDPIKVQPNTLSTGNLNKNGLDNKISKPQTLLDLNSNKTDKPEDKRKEETKGRDVLELSVEAQSVLQAKEIDPTTNNNLVLGQLEKSALEFRGLQQVSKSRELTPTETTKLNQIKETFAQAGIDEGGITKIAERRLQQIQQDAPQIVKQFEAGNVNADLFAQLNQVNESLNKANGFGIGEQDLKAPAEEVAKVKSDFNSLVEVTKDRQLTQKDVAALESLTRQLSTIQGFQINIRNSVGQDGILA